jgi:hypothetical protein
MSLNGYQVEGGLRDMTVVDNPVTPGTVEGAIQINVAVNFGDPDGRKGYSYFLRCGPREGSTLDRSGTDHFQGLCNSLGSDGKCASWTVRPTPGTQGVCTLFENVNKGKNQGNFRVADWAMPFTVDICNLSNDQACSAPE